MRVTLDNIVGRLEALAPLQLAASWDNVGLLVEPIPRAEARVNRILLTIDLTEAVLSEALIQRAELIIAYHPPIFSGLRRLTQGHAPQRIALTAIAQGVAIYSPHTAVDATPGGVNDWLADAFGDGERAPIEASVDGAPGSGLGRRVRLARGRTIGELVQQIKQHLGLAQVRLARSAIHADGGAVDQIFVCAGAGGSLFEGVKEQGLFLTGEMRHHDVLDRVARGSSVILCDHTNTERGFLKRYAAQISAWYPAIEVSVSRVDRDPLEIV